MKAQETKEIVFQEQKQVKKITSPDKSKVLVLNFTESMNPRKEFSYKVIDIKTNKELISGFFTGVNMSWLDDKNIKGHPYIGIVQSNPESTIINYTIININ